MRGPTRSRSRRDIAVYSQCQQNKFAWLGKCMHKQHSFNIISSSGGAVVVAMRATVSSFLYKCPASLSSCFICSLYIDTN